MKKIAQMKKDELLMLALEHELDVEESMTKEEIKNMISDAGITDENTQEEDSHESSAPAETEEEILVRMVDPPKHYVYGKYHFTKENPFEVMKKEDADATLERSGDLFRKASEDEIRRFFGE